MNNQKIKCDVSSCKHNCHGENCELDSIKVTCGCGCGKDCTCCGDFCERN